MLRWKRWLLPARGAKAAAVEITEMENAYQGEPMVITGNGLGPNVGSWLLVYYPMFWAFGSKWVLCNLQGTTFIAGECSDMATTHRDLHDGHS